jgi:hypothetical protein
MPRDEGKDMLWARYSVGVGWKDGEHDKQ